LGWQGTRFLRNKVSLSEQKQCWNPAHTEPATKFLGFVSIDLEEPHATAKLLSSGLIVWRKLVTWPAPICPKIKHEIAAIAINQLGGNLSRDIQGFCRRQPRFAFGAARIT
jgi:hypothetical protein